MPLNQAQKETLLVWTILTSNRFEMDMNGAKELKKALKKLKIDAKPLLLAANTTHLDHFIAIRNLFHDTGFAVAGKPVATTAVAADGGLAIAAAAAVSGGGAPWSGNGSHPSLDELSPLFQVA